jgi:hypothetical protein
MKWDAVQIKARNRGYLIFAMDQAQTDVCTMPGPWGAAHKGFCTACAIRWITLRYGGSDFAYDPKTMVVEPPDLLRDTRDQNIYCNEKGRFPINLVNALALYGLTLNLGRLTKQKELNGMLLTQAGLAGEGCYLTYMSHKGGAHMVAIQNMGSSGWRVFDANFGSFYAKSDYQFLHFMEWYLELTGYRRTYTVFTGIVGVNPPPYVSATAFGSSVMDLIKWWCPSSG